MDYYEDKTEFLEQLEVVVNAVDELEKFSVYQNDLVNDEIYQIGVLLDTIKEKIKNNNKKGTKAKDWKKELNEKLDELIEGIERLQLKP